MPFEEELYKFSLKNTHFPECYGGEKFRSCEFSGIPLSTPSQIFFSQMPTYAEATTVLVEILLKNIYFSGKFVGHTSVVMPTKLSKCLQKWQ